MEHGSGTIAARFHGIWGCAFYVDVAAACVVLGAVIIAMACANTSLSG